MFSSAAAGQAPSLLLLFLLLPTQSLSNYHSSAPDSQPSLQRAADPPQQRVNGRRSGYHQRGAEGIFLLYVAVKEEEEEEEEEVLSPDGWMDV